MERTQHYRVTYRPGSNLPVGRGGRGGRGGHHSTEAGGTTLVFRTVRRVAFQEREV